MNDTNHDQPVDPFEAVEAVRTAMGQVEHPARIRRLFAVAAEAIASAAATQTRNGGRLDRLADATEELTSLRVEFEQSVTPSNAEVMTFSISMADVMNAWRGRWVQSADPDDDGRWGQGPDTVEEAIVIAAANALVVEMTDRKRELQSAVKVEAVKIVNETLRDTIVGWVAEQLEAPIQQTNTYGEPAGKAITIRELVEQIAGKALTEKRYDDRGQLAYNGSGRGSQTLVEALVSAQVTGQMTKELKATVDAAKATAVEAVQDEATKVVSTVIADRLAALKG